MNFPQAVEQWQHRIQRRLFGHSAAQLREMVKQAVAL